MATRLKHLGEEPPKKAKKKDFSEIVEEVILFPGKATFAVGEFLQRTTGSSLMGIAGLSLATIGFCIFLAPLGDYGPAVCCASVTAFAVKEGAEKRSQEQHLKENINTFVGKLPFTNKVSLQMAIDLRQHIEYPAGIGELLYGVYRHFQQYMVIK